MRFQSFSSLLKHYAAAAPEAPALLTGDGDAPVCISYRELEQRVQARAEALRGSRKTSECILCDGTAANVIEIFAAVRAGLQVTLLNGSADGALVTAADADLLWGDEDAAEELAPYLTAGVTDGAGRMLFYTSGTTGRSKAVALTEQSLCASAYNGGALLPLAETDVLMCMLPLDHVFGFVCGLLWGLSCGACVALGRGPRHYFDDLTFFKPTALSAVPTLLRFLLERRLMNPELKTVLIGAGDCPPDIPRDLKALGKRVCFGYGLTETSSGVALSLGDDPYAMTVCPEDTVTIAPDGEILVEAPTCVMQGYYKDPADTAEVLRDGVLHTGDLGAFDAEGLLHITGRKKEILVFPDGTKIYLPEYEQTLAEELHGREFAVVDLSGAPVLVIRGDESERVDLTLRLTAVMRGLPIGRRLRDMIFVQEPLPRTATGKIKRWELQQKVRNL